MHTSRPGVVLSGSGTGSLWRLERLKSGGLETNQWCVCLLRSAMQRPSSLITRRMTSKLTITRFYEMTRRWEGNKGWALELITVWYWTDEGTWLDGVLHYHSLIYWSRYRRIPLLPFSHHFPSRHALGRTFIGKRMAISCFSPRI